MWMTISLAFASNPNSGKGKVFTINDEAVYLILFIVCTINAVSNSKKKLRRCRFGIHILDFLLHDAGTRRRMSSTMKRVWSVPQCTLSSGDMECKANSCLRQVGVNLKPARTCTKNKKHQETWTS